MKTHRLPMFAILGTSLETGETIAAVAANTEADAVSAKGELELQFRSLMAHPSVSTDDALKIAESLKSLRVAKGIFIATEGDIAAIVTPDAAAA